jgi:prephenate dehydrogenase
MAGKESRGVLSADPDLFAGRPYVLTPTSEPVNHELEFRDWLQQIGAVIVEMDAEQHDLTVAGTSHLPQLLATTLALTLSQAGNPFSNRVFGPGLLDMTRLALSAPEVWLSVLRTNRDAVKVLLNTYQRQLSVIESALEHDEKFSELFSEAAHFARTLREQP